LRQHILGATDSGLAAAVIRGGWRVVRPVLRKVALDREIMMIVAMYDIETAHIALL